LQNLWVIDSDDINSHKEEYELLVRRGWIYWNDMRTKVFFLCPIVKQMILVGIHSGIVRPQTDNFKTLAEFMDAVLSRFSTNYFMDEMSQNVNSAISEAKWQNEFYKIGKSLLGFRYEIGVEVSYVSSDNVEMMDTDDDEAVYSMNGKLDFYINSNRQWAVEFLVRGDLISSGGVSELEKHVDRFEKGGAYYHLPRKEQVIVDYRPLCMSHSTKDFKSLIKPTPTFYPNTWIVLYELVDKVASLNVVKYDKHGNYWESRKYHLLPTT